MKQFVGCMLLVTIIILGGLCLVEAVEVTIQAPAFDGQTPVSFIVSLVPVGPGGVPLELEDGILNTAFLQEGVQYVIAINGTFVNEAGNTLYPCPCVLPEHSDLEEVIKRLQILTGIR